MQVKYTSVRVDHLRYKVRYTSIRVDNVRYKSSIHQSELII